VLAGGAAFAAVETKDHLSAWDGVWWAIQTVTTVGYGNPPVTTDGGRIIAICLMVTGIGFVAVLTVAAAERFVRSRRAEEERARAERQEIRGTPGRHHHPARCALTAITLAHTELRAGAVPGRGGRRGRSRKCFARSTAPRPI
jgi:Ion channel